MSIDYLVHSVIIYANRIETLKLQSVNRSTHLLHPQLKKLFVTYAAKNVEGCQKSRKKNQLVFMDSAFTKFTLFTEYRSFKYAWHRHIFSAH